ncbi:hypothetical protein OVA07_07395 [Novosphingobium sp. SL115]|uniref:hypothetical protein n=1 Tax=Novosphingobium sp. SL115 TaxID=2995150 RepID=UPI0022752825|nr:hypothetical protein [Novosphingobium sp. SL115]MCY1670839.1 hypothetical protein [Novosphingobium sp. SL115]
MKSRIAIGLGGLNLALVAAAVLSTFVTPAQAQGVNKGIVEKPNRAVACPSGWKTPDGDTALCEAQGSLAPKIYGKKEKDTCADGYFEVYRVWCSTKRP